MADDGRSPPQAVPTSRIGVNMSSLREGAVAKRLREPAGNYPTLHGKAPISILYGAVTCSFRRGERNRKPPGRIEKAIPPDPIGTILAR